MALQLPLNWKTRFIFCNAPLDNSGVIAFVMPFETDVIVLRLTRFYETSWWREPFVGFNENLFDGHAGVFQMFTKIFSKNRL